MATPPSRNPHSVSRRTFLTGTAAGATAAMLGRPPAAVGQQVRELQVWHTEVEPQTVKVNDKDLLLQNIRANKDGLIAKVLPPTSDVESDSRLLVWDLVLDKG